MEFGLMRCTCLDVRRNCAPRKWRMLLLTRLMKSATDRCPPSDQCSESGVSPVVLKILAKTTRYYILYLRGAYISQDHNTTYFHTTDYLK